MKTDKIDKIEKVEKNVAEESSIKAKKKSSYSKKKK